MTGRAVIHLNVADFAVAVERALDARLKKAPLIVAAPSARAVVYDMSDDAYREGVRKGMPLWRARKFSSRAAVVSPRPERYERAMRMIFEKTLRYSPRVELVDEKGHLFLDITGTRRLFGPPEDVAWRLRGEVKRGLGFDPVWSVAPNKLVAKVATRMVKPLGEYVVEEGEEEDFLREIPLALIPGIERGDAALLRDMNLKTAGDVARWSLWQLETVFEKRARHLHEVVRGVDTSPVLSASDGPPSVSVDHPFADDTNDARVAEGAIWSCAEKAGAELRRRRLAAGRVGVTVDYSDGVRVIRSAITDTPTANDFSLFRLAMRALEFAWKRRVRIRHFKVMCDKLCFPPAQVELFADDCERNRLESNVILAVDNIRKRFGERSVFFGRSLQRPLAP